MTDARSCRTPPSYPPLPPPDHAADVLLRGAARSRLPCCGTRAPPARGTARGLHTRSNRRLGRPSHWLQCGCIRIVFGSRPTMSGAFPRTNIDGTRSIDRADSVDRSRWPQRVQCARDHPGVVGVRAIAAPVLTFLRRRTCCTASCSWPANTGNFVRRRGPCPETPVYPLHRRSTFRTSAPADRAGRHRSEMVVHVSGEASSGPGEGCLAGKGCMGALDHPE